jgi:hypothetical protein
MSEKISHTLNADVIIDYTNWRGERSSRRVRPSGEMSFAGNQWHPEPQWLFEAYCYEDTCHKWFAMSGVHEWRAVNL